MRPSETLLSLIAFSAVVAITENEPEAEVERYTLQVYVWE